MSRWSDLFDLAGACQTWQSAGGPAVLMILSAPLASMLLAAGGRRLHPSDAQGSTVISDVGGHIFMFELAGEAAAKEKAEGRCIPCRPAFSDTYKHCHEQAHDDDRAEAMRRRKDEKNVEKKEEAGKGGEGKRTGWWPPPPPPPAVKARLLQPTRMQSGIQLSARRRPHRLGRGRRRRRPRRLPCRTEFLLLEAKSDGDCFMPQAPRVELPPAAAQPAQGGGHRTGRWWRSPEGEWFPLLSHMLHGGSSCVHEICT